MKIIIFSILFTVQAQYMNEDMNEGSTVSSDLNLGTKSSNENDKNNMSDILNITQIQSIDMNISTISPDINSDDGTDESYTQTSISTFPSAENFDINTSNKKVNSIVEERWHNVNESSKQNPLRSMIFWKRLNSSSKFGASYSLTSKPLCLRQMCSVKFKYNGTLSNKTSGCLSFSVHTNGQPVGQLWVVADQEQDNASQRIQLANKTLLIEHSLKSKIKSLAIETRILFRNSQIDNLTITNLNVNWKGPCPKHRIVPTPSPNFIPGQSTLDDLITLSSDGSGLMSSLTTDDEFQSSQQHLMYESTTIIYNDKNAKRRSSSLLNQKNIGWFLSLITFFCIIMILSAVGHGLWLMRRHYFYSWHVTFDAPIQFLARRSIRSSTRSEYKIATISQLTNDYLDNNSQKDYTDTQTMDSSQSSPMSYYTYL